MSDFSFGLFAKVVSSVIKTAGKYAKKCKICGVNPGTHGGICKECYYNKRAEDCALTAWKTLIFSLIVTPLIYTKSPEVALVLGVVFAFFFLIHFFYGHPNLSYYLFLGTFNAIRGALFFLVFYIFFGITYEWLPYAGMTFLTWYVIFYSGESKRKLK